MAIFGSLTDMPLADLLPMLGRRSGVLEMWNLEGRKSASLWLDEGRLKCVWLLGKPLDSLSARSLMTELISAKQGSFEFMLGAPSLEGGSRLDWPVEQVLLSVASIADEQEALRRQLPDPETRFQAVNLEIWLEEPLFGFWQQAKPLLAAGASANQIAQKLGMPADQVRYYLHKLRLAGRVSPVRAYQHQPVNEERRSLANRLLAALFGRRK